jgi:hypothetical protein
MKLEKAIRMQIYERELRGIGMWMGKKHEAGLAAAAAQ